ncbi:MAG: serine/threonine protein kinase [Deltaproteobacteria bacterium]|nr:serine/threonine protein kinase [Deltaproteobacteria bacterium]
MEEDRGPIAQPLPDAAPDAAPPPERYRTLRLLGAGGMGEVYLAAQEGPQGFRRIVALKRIRPAATDQQRLLVRHFLDEARLVAKLSHRNVVQIHELGDGPEGLFVAREFVRGPSIERLLGKLALSDARMPPALALDVAAQVADGLDYAFSARDEAGVPLRIVHRDVSSQNVLVSVTGDVKLIDFGVAKSSHQQQVTTSPVVKGKIAYMSPEQSRAEPLDGRSDLFCLGIVLFEMLTGQHPFLCSDPLSTLKAIEAAQWPRLKDLAPELADCDPVLEKLLARSREERFASGAAASDAIALLRPKLPAPPSRLGPFVAGLFGAEFAELERQPEPGTFVPGPIAPPLEATAQRPASNPTKEEFAPTMLRTPVSKLGAAGVVNVTPLSDSQRIRSSAVKLAPRTSRWRMVGFGAAMLVVGAAGGLAATLALRQPTPVAPPPPELVAVAPAAIEVLSPPPPPPSPPSVQPDQLPEAPAVPKPGQVHQALPVSKPVAKKPPAPVSVPEVTSAIASPTPAPSFRYEITVEGPSGTSRVSVGALPDKVLVLESPVRVQLELSAGKALLDCEPWQIVSVSGESIGRSPVAIPPIAEWPVRIGLKKPPGSQRLELKLSVRSLEGD